MTELNQIGSLLSRMTTEDKITFDKDQVTRIVEILIPKIVTELPGMPAGMTCQVKKDDKGWDIRVERP